MTLEVGAKESPDVGASIGGHGFGRQRLEKKSSSTVPRMPGVLALGFPRENPGVHFLAFYFSKKMKLWDFTPVKIENV